MSARLLTDLVGKNRMPDSDIIQRFFPLAGLQEDVIWTEHIIPHLHGLPENVLQILAYGFSEILNNAIDHSEGFAVGIALERSPEAIKITIVDDGIGIFDKIQSAFNLNDPHDAILELSKGKLTTDPEHHTGEGIFFTSRACDSFFIMSKAIRFFRYLDADWLVERDPLAGKGTGVTIEVNPATNRTLKEIFEKFTSPDEDFGFTRTQVQISLAQYGTDGLLSRSKARRVLNRFSRFKEVVLDFAGVDFIGPAFADEIFRVYRNAHPDVHITWVHANESVEKLIQKALHTETPSDASEQ